MIVITPATISDAFLFTTQVNDVFSASISPFNPVFPETVTSMVITADTADESITLANGTNSCSITGKYTSLIKDLEFTYITKGKSNLTETPVSVSNIDKIPDGKQVYEYHSPTLSKTVTYTITAKTSLNNTLTKTYTRTVYNTWDNGKNQLSYLKEQGKV